MDLLAAIKDMFRTIKLPKGINHAFITLIPKNNRPANITHLIVDIYININVTSCLVVHVLYILSMISYKLFN